eukprot:3815392-Amphidinium_carterae.1
MELWHQLLGEREKVPDDDTVQDPGQASDAAARDSSGARQGPPPHPKPQERSSKGLGAKHGNKFNTQYQLNTHTKERLTQSNKYGENASRPAGLPSFVDDLCLISMSPMNGLWCGQTDLHSAISLERAEVHRREEVRQ